MITRRIDRGLEALHQCETAIPGLADVFREGSPERAALHEVCMAAKRARQILSPGGKSD